MRCWRAPARAIGLQVHAARHRSENHPLLRIARSLPGSARAASEGIHSYVPGLRSSHRSGRNANGSDTGPRDGAATGCYADRATSGRTYPPGATGPSPPADDRDHGTTAHRLVDDISTCLSASWPERTASTGRGGVRRAQKALQAHASEFAVVSKPASSSVTSSSRSSPSERASPSSVRADSSSEDIPRTRDWRLHGVRR